MKKLCTLLAFGLLSLGAQAQANLAINPSITSPTSACYMSNAETITCTIVNVSATPYAGTLEVGYILNGGTPVIQNQTIGFMPGSGTFIYSFPNPDSFAACDTHHLTIWVHDVNDPDNSNDTIQTYVLSDCDPTGGWISGTTPVCIGMNSGDAVLNGSFGVVQSWATSIDGGSTWSWVSTTDTFLTYSNVTDETVFQAVVGSPFGLCPNDTSSWFTLEIDSLSDAGVLPPDFDICDNGNGGYINTTGFVGTPVQWLLSTNGGVGWIPVGGNDTVYYNNLQDTTTYAVIVQNGSCPPDTSAYITLTLIQGTVAGAIDGPTVVCNWDNDDVLTTSGGNGNVIEWYVSNDSVSWQPTITGASPTFDFQGITQDTWFAAEYQFGTCPTEWAVWGITVLPVVSQVTPDTTINEGDAINLDVCCGNTYLWWPDQFIDDITSPTPIVDPDSDITYFCQITTIEGCKDTVRIVVSVLPDLTTLAIPNLFTPNGDGFNDNWEIGNIQAFDQNELTIFNIYGQVVFSSSPYSNEWEGTFDGNPLPDGSYFYYLDLGDPLLYPDPIKGVVTIAGND